MPQFSPSFRLVVPGRLPSWNQILAMHHWSRKKFKDNLTRAFLCALRASAGDCSMKITSAKSSTLTYADTLASFLTTRRNSSKSKSRNAKRNRRRKNTR